MSSGASPNDGPPKVSRSRHCLVLVNNPCVNDSRVIKSAEALASAGWRVTVIARHSPGIPSQVTHNGVDYVRLGGIKTAMQALGRRLRAKNEKRPRHVLSNQAPSPAHNSGALSGLVSRFRRLVRELTWYFEAEEFLLASYPVWRSMTFDAVHAHDLNTLEAGRRAARRRGAALVYDSHELETHRNTAFPAWVQRKRSALERRAIRDTTAVVTVSDSIARHLQQLYGIPQPLVVLNAPDFADSDEAKGDVRATLKLPAETPLLVYVGGVTFHRGIEQGVDAIAELPRAHFAIIGPRQLDMETRMQRMLAAKGLLSRVHLIEPIPPADVVPFIRTADASLLAIQDACLSYRYCMPNKLLESAFAGVPVIASDFPDMRQFVTAQACGVIVESNDPSAIAQAFVRILAHRSHYVPGDASRRALREVYGWPAQASKLVQLFAGMTS